MAALSIAIVGKDNEPLYIKEFARHKNEKRQQDDEAKLEAELYGLSSLGSETNDDSDTNDQPTTSTALSSTTPIDCSLKQQFILHAALDRFAQLEGPPPGFGWRNSSNNNNAAVNNPAGNLGSGSPMEAMFAGLLTVVEDMRVYGYMTTTQIKFLLLVQDALVPIDQQKQVDDGIRKLLVKMHRIYVEHHLNPFSTLAMPIASFTFDDKLHRLVHAYNQVGTEQ